ncbi:MAG: ABC transporter permease [Nitrospira sp.]|nr:ABC transporter permease [Nitrospira sp.]
MDLVILGATVPSRAVAEVLAASKMIRAAHTTKQWIPLAIVGMGLSAGIVATQISMDHARAGIPMLQRSSYVPDGHLLKVAALGYREVVADVLWLQVIQAMGDKYVSPETGRWIYHTLDVVTTLDPTFVRAYEAGAHALCTMVVMPEESNRLLEKGIRHNPREWRLPFLLGPILPQIVTMPAFMLLSITTALGVGLWASALNIRHRDIGHAVPFVTQLWFFATPVAYPSSLVPASWHAWYGINPMASVVEGCRWSLFGGGGGEGSMLVLSLLVSSTLFLSGLYFFRRTEQTFADVA